MPDVTVPQPPPLARVNGVELIHTGTWPISTGVWTATTQDLQGAVAALDCPAVRRPGIKIGHQDGRFTDPTQDGDPLLGYVDNLTVTDDGRTLVGDFAGMPAWLAGTDGTGSVLSSAYPYRSIEGVHDYVCQIGHTHPFVLDAVALLGVTPPGIGTLQSLQDIAALYGVAASAPTNGVQIRATVPVANTAAAAGGRSPMPNPRPTQVAAGVTTEDVRRQYYDDAAWSHWIVEFHVNPLQMIVVDDNSGKRFRVPVEVTGEDTFTFGEPVEVLTRYIDAETSEPVAAAAGAERLVYASRAESRPGKEPKAAEPDPIPEPEPLPIPTGPPVVDDPTPPTPPVDPEPPAAEPEPTTEPKEEDPVSDLSEFRSRLGLPDDADEATILAAFDARLQPTEPTPDPTPEPAPTATPAPQPELVAASNPFADELKRVSEELAQIRAEKATAAKSAVLDGAVKAGKIRPADKSDWSTRYDKAPEVITDVLASIADGTAVPVAATGEVTDPDEGAAKFNQTEYDRLFSTSVPTGKDA